MITRYIFTGYHTSENIKPKDNKEVLNLSVFTYREKIYMYFESENPNVDPESVVSGDLKEFPDGSHWMRMYDIFHYAKPKSKEHWERKIPNKNRIMRLMYLRDEMVASYVFNHYRYQEEIPGDGDKYGYIGLLGNMLAFYLEEPVELDPEAEGSLTTHDTPIDRWGQEMEKHFRMEPYEKTFQWKMMKRIY